LRGVLLGSVVTAPALVLTGGFHSNNFEFLDWERVIGRRLVPLPDVFFGVEFTDPDKIG
jgi:hypothetical protein